MDKLVFLDSILEIVDSILEFLDSILEIVDSILEFLDSILEFSDSILDFLDSILEIVDSIFVYQYLLLFVLATNTTHCVPCLVKSFMKPNTTILAQKSSLTPS